MTDVRRVLVLNHFAAPRGQAGGTRHVELFDRLSGWDYLIIASDLNPQTGLRILSEPGFAVVPVPPYSSNGIRRMMNWVVYAARSTLLGLRQRRVDVLYGSSPHLLAATAAGLIAFIKRVPFVMEVRDLWPQVLVEMGQLSERSLVFRLLSVIERLLYRQAQAIVVLAEGSRRTLIERGIPEAKIHYIPNGADTEDFVPSATRAALRERYGFTGFTAVYTGAHGPANGLNLLLDAAGKISNVDIVLIGGGVEKSALVDRAEAAGLKNVRFMDAVPKMEIPDILAAADVGLHVLADVPLFQSAISPNKVFDYMAAGLPVLTNSPGVVGDLVTGTGAGIVVEPSQLASGLRQISSMGSEVKPLGAAGKAWIAANQSRTAMAARLGQTLASLEHARG